MKVNLKVSKLADILDISSRFVSKNSTLPILQNIYIKASIDTVIFRSTDMEKYVEIEMPADIKAEGAITVNSKTFSDIVFNIEDDEVEISVDQQSQIMTIKSGKDVFEINGISASEYVALPEVPQENNISIDATMISDGIKKVEYSVTEKNFSPVLTGIMMKSKDQNTIVFVGTDSFRLTEYKIQTENIGDFQVIIPKIAINDIKKIADYSTEHESNNVSMKYSENLVAFEFQIDDMKILATSLLIQGTFPDYEREDIMPTQFNVELMVDKEQCEKAIKKIAILTKDINNFIQIEADTDSITISSGKTDKGKGKTNIPAIIKGEGLTFGINGRYITDFIKSTESENITFNIVDAQKPILINDPNQVNYKYIVRPLINS